MRTRALVGGVLASLGILLGSWELGVTATPTTTTTDTSGTGASASGPTGSGSSGTGTSGSTSGSGSGGTSTGTGATASVTTSDGTWTGSSVSTRFGNVQVQVTISGGTITDVTALRLTDADGRSVSISNRAAPTLRSEVLSAQSANVSNVSGATYTSNAYLRSLQSALDQAGF